MTGREWEAWRIRSELVRRQGGAVMRTLTPFLLAWLAIFAFYYGLAGLMDARDKRRRQARARAKLIARLYALTGQTGKGGQ